jgi:hypothetical protein
VSKQILRDKAFPAVKAQSSEHHKKDSPHFKRHAMIWMRNVFIKIDALMICMPPFNKNNMDAYRSRTETTNSQHQLYKRKESRQSRGSKLLYSISN